VRMRQGLGRIRITIVLALCTSIAAPASAHALDVTPTASTAATTVTSAANDIGATAGEAATTPSSSVPVPNPSIDVSQPVRSQPVRDLAQEATGAKSPVSDQPARPSLPDVSSVVKPAAGAVDDVTRPAGGTVDTVTKQAGTAVDTVTHDVGGPQEQVTSTVRSTNTAVQTIAQTIDSARQQSQQLVGDVGRVPPASGPPGGGVTPPPSALSDGGIGGVLGDHRAPRPPADGPPGGGVGGGGPTLPSTSPLNGGGPAGGVGGKSILRAVGASDGPSGGGSPRDFVSTLSDHVLAPVLSGPAFLNRTLLTSFLTVQSAATGAPATLSGAGRSPRSPAPAPSPFALPALGSAASSSLLLFSALLAVLAIFFLTAPGLGRRLTPQAQKWLPPGLVSPLALPG
jgi:hypothetical protein